MNTIIDENEDEKKTKTRKVVLNLGFCVVMLVIFLIGYSLLHPESLIASSMKSGINDAIAIVQSDKKPTPTSATCADGLPTISLNISFDKIDKSWIDSLPSEGDGETKICVVKDRYQAFVTTSFTVNGGEMNGQHVTGAEFLALHYSWRSTGSLSRYTELTKVFENPIQADDSGLLWIILPGHLVAFTTPGNVGPEGIDIVTTMTPFQPFDGQSTVQPFPTITGIVQTPYALPTATPKTVATAISGGIVSLPEISINDLILKTNVGNAIWDLPGVDSIEVKLGWNGSYNYYAGWAPSFTNAQYTFGLTDIEALSSSALKAGCSAFNYTDQSGFIYEQRVSMGLRFSFSDSAGINYYTFPAGQTSAGYCLVWPTPTPIPIPINPPTPLPADIVPTPTDWLNNCNITISWDSLVNNPGQVTGSGNGFLGKHNVNDSGDNQYIGDATGYSIIYCITGRPTTLGGRTWDGQKISLIGPLYNQSYEVNVFGNIWVSMVSQP